MPVNQSRNQTWVWLMNSNKDCNRFCAWFWIPHDFKIVESCIWINCNLFPSLEIFLMLRRQSPKLRILRLTDCPLLGYIFTDDYFLDSVLFSHLSEFPPWIACKLLYHNKMHLRWLEMPYFLPFFSSRARQVVFRKFKGHSVILSQLGQ